ncbi:Vegetative incompatibility protein HET-E-1 [Rhizoctonia solani]|uniref:Vegetative incompatibility protein HET-E-1 n=1 Tax=Rhizoctonia solani TaxID=456999 RepID=A0A8H8T0P8_9AGAM|nr:Vegetative incompatibility protein HET-E-1 [Rhizoctonia solani]QRW25631.1 Vegetative incompatibility protein HET-E-1 [Rhizoctonia solani]
MSGKIWTSCGFSALLGFTVSGSPIDSRAPTPDPDSPQNASQSSARSHGTSPQPSAPPQPTSGSSTQANQTITSQIAILNQPKVVVDSNSTPQTHKSSWTGLEKALHALQISTKGCPPLHSAVDGLISCLHVFREAAKFRKDYDELADGLAAMVQLLANYSLVGASREITEKMNGIAEKIKDELESIDKRQSRGATLRILGPSSDDDDLVRRYRKIEQLFRQLQAEASMSTWNDTKKHLVNTQLESLGPVKLATYNSTISMDIGRRSCTENTRTQILGDLMDWANDPHKAKIYWMNGMAGTGKTTIACSLCERLDAAGQLAASFFCTRTSRECSEAKRIVPTLAYQIARRSAPFRDALCGLAHNKAASGFQGLIRRNLVVVIDALDECSDPHIVKVVLDILFRHAVDLPVKFFVTSRPEPTIRNSMMLGIAENERPHSILYLHEIEKSLVQADIELYLRDELKHMLSSDDEAIKELSEQAGIYLYMRAYKITLAMLSGLDGTDLATSALEPLRSVLHVSEHNSYVTTLHASFPDFMFSQERSQKYFCNRSSHNQFLARHCLEIMKIRLCFNICQLESSYLLDDEVPDLNDRVEALIPPVLRYASRFWVDHLTQGTASEHVFELVYDFLSYRLLFWMEVMNLTKFMVAGAVVSTKLHMWLRVSDGSRVSEPFEGHSHRVNCATFSSDSMRIVSGSEDKTIRIWAVHNPAGLGLKLVGHAGTVRSLMFSPDDLMIASGSIDRTIRIWDAINGTCIRILQGHTQSISCVRFSPCGEYIFSGSNDHTVRVWNTYSGASIGDPLRGHTSYVTSIAVSPEGERIASGSLDRTVRIWHRASGSLWSDLSRATPTQLDRSNSQLTVRGLYRLQTTKLYAYGAQRVNHGAAQIKGRFTASRL